MLITLLATVVVLGVLILVHELGHFITAKMADIEVPRFSIGLGPKAWGFRIGETEYVVSWLPLGGYVKMAGLEDMESLEGGPAEGPARRAATEGSGATDAGLLAAPEAEEGERYRASPRGFDTKPVGVRAIVIAAGVAMNFAFAFLIYSFMAGVWGVAPPMDTTVGSVIEERLPPGTRALAEVAPGRRVTAVGARGVSNWRELQNALTLAGAGPTAVHFADGETVTIDLPADDSTRAVMIFSLRQAVEPVIGRVIAGLPADRAGIRSGDRVIRAGGQEVGTWDELVSIVQGSPGDPLDLVVLREGREVPLTITPEAESMVGPDGRTEVFGHIGVSTPRHRPGLLGSFAHGARETWHWTSFTVEFLGELVTGGVSARNLGGPILIGQLSGRFARAGVEAFLGFMALLSVNLAIFNLLPIPILDGGQLMFLGIEAVRGRALSIEQRMRFSQVGMVVLVALIVWVVTSDVLRLFGL